MDKEKRIAKELRKLNKLFTNLDENQKQTAAGLIRSAAFMAVSLEDLQEIINKEGYLDEYENGANQTGIKISAAVQTYNSMVGRYTTIITKLLKIVPAAERKQPKQTAAEIQRENKAKTEQAKMEERKARETAFLEALGNGRVTQGDYSAFMAGEIN